MAFLGQDGFVWAIGVVEDRFDPEKQGRVRVRWLGYHTDEKARILTINNKNITLQKILIGILLHLDEIRHFGDFGNPPKIFPQSPITHIRLWHSRLSL